MNMPELESQKAYRQFRNRLDAMTAEAWETYKSKMACKAGCSACCRGDFHIALIEGLAVKEAVNALPEETKKIIAHNIANPNPDRCPLLIDDRCSIYNERPILCRIFGFPIATAGKLTACELNFTDERDRDFSARAFDRDVIGQTLAAISKLLLAETGSPPPPEGSDPPAFLIREVLENLS